MSQRDCNGILENVSGMSGTEDSSQDDWEMMMLLIFWYLHNDIIFTITNIQIYAQIHN